MIIFSSNIRLITIDGFERLLTRNDVSSLKFYVINIHKNISYWKYKNCYGDV